ncbi:hypothetical protein B0H67DRAFT_660748 [Lasiosphaeris hirsuta]|uniref:Uncharacterized protein n=1 Tax=Lasiosphaeris hirsuta TaxID=260670 RepID=A0AA40ANW2_9PEZI|nr:hypothetical protein B0H67DRAFT_660748 [Lasiosphaeris hirsuta]
MSDWRALPVYGCRSDTESPTKGDDVVLSVTSFIDAPLTFAVLYGSTQNTKKLAEVYLRQIKASDLAWHPLLLPMLFAELERKRLLNLLDREQTRLQQRLLEMENELRGEAAGVAAILEKPDGDTAAAVKEYESTRLWIDVSKLKNSLESLKTQLASMTGHSRMLRQSVLVARPGEADTLARERATGEVIESRLGEMMGEFDSKIRSCESLLGGFGMAAQMDWNYYTRRDSRANIIIANATKRDGSQMRMISLLGMTFLPGTFLATMFSMGFFNWSPTDDRIISPWITLYVGLTITLTTLTLWQWKRWTTEEEKNARLQLKRELESDSDLVWMVAAENV